jgi:hypothetical protein
MKFTIPPEQFEILLIHALQLIGVDAVPDASLGKPTRNS